MGWACGTYGGGENLVEVLVEDPFRIHNEEPYEVLMIDGLFEGGGLGV
jgi:hypothetical protein